MKSWSLTCRVIMGWSAEDKKIQLELSFLMKDKKMRTNSWRVLIERWLCWHKFWMPALIGIWFRNISNVVIKSTGGQPLGPAIWWNVVMVHVFRVLRKGSWYFIWVKVLECFHELSQEEIVRSLCFWNSYWWPSDFSGLSIRLELRCFPHSFYWKLNNASWWRL